MIVSVFPQEPASLSCKDIDKLLQLDSTYNTFFFKEPVTLDASNQKRLLDLKNQLAKKLSHGFYLSQETDQDFFEIIKGVLNDQDPPQSSDDRLISFAGRLKTTFFNVMNWQYTIYPAIKIRLEGEQWDILFDTPLDFLASQIDVIESV